MMGYVRFTCSRQIQHFPSSLVLQYPPLRIGVIHGHQVLPPGDKTSLSLLADSMNVDILISGNTHQLEAYRHGSHFFLNPGSATGAWTLDTPSSHTSNTHLQGHGKPTTHGITSESPKNPGPEKPPENQSKELSSTDKQISMETVRSFACTFGSHLTVVLDIQGSVVVIYIYQLIDDDVKVEKIEYRKESGSHA